MWVVEFLLFLMAIDTAAVGLLHSARCLAAAVPQHGTQQQMRAVTFRQLL